MRFSNVNAHFLRRFALLGALVCEGRAGFRRAGVRSFEAHDEAVNSLQLIVANCETGRSVSREPADAQTDRQTAHCEYCDREHGFLGAW